MSILRQRVCVYVFVRPSHKRGEMIKVERSEKFVFRIQPLAAHVCFSSARRWLSGLCPIKIGLGCSYPLRSFVAMGAGQETVVTFVGELPHRHLVLPMPPLPFLTPSPPRFPSGR
ncbi:hypothetical protein BGZ63DRAFT_153646 [Mariannaea sp. PMI_226]|nr:hypothetical protein BGZ63DRAFT_153646 [Mariannaea sp. PMI_226]